MSRLIKLTENEKEEIAKSVLDAVFKAKSLDGKIEVSAKLPEIERTAHIFFTAAAYAKMVSLIMVSDKEVGWYCTAERYGELNDDIYIIDDVLVFPQEVTGVTVDSDDEARVEWFDSLPVEVLTKIKCDCHSHVNMSTGPSGTDVKDMESVLKNLGEDQYRIFMIWNKKLEFSCRIYDMEKNICFETKDVMVDVIDVRINEFLSTAKAMVRNKVSSPVKYTGATAAAKKTAEPKKETKTTKSSKASTKKAAPKAYDYYDDDDFMDGFLEDYYGYDSDYYPGYSGRRYYGNGYWY